MMLFFSSESSVFRLASTSALVCTLSIFSTGCSSSSKTWKDPETGLEWQKCSLGQTWNGSGCDGIPRKYTFDQAQEAVKALGRGWRVPAASELASLIRCNTGFRETGELPDRKGGMKTMSIWCNSYPTSPTIDTTIFPNTPDSLYWSASPDARNYNNAWFVSFGSGGAVNYVKYHNFHVRAVRTDQ